MTEKVDKVPFEDALTMTGFGRFNVLVFILCGIIILGMAFEIFSVSYLVPSSACELGTTSTQQGLMAGVPLTGIIASSHIWGYLADTRGRRKILRLCMTMGFVAGSLAALSPNWIVLSIMKFFASAAVSGAFALSLTLLSECTPMANRTTLLLLTNSVFLGATGLMAVLSIPILPMKFSYYIPYLDIHFNSWRLLDLVLSFPSAFGAIGVAFAYESPKYLLSVGKDKKALEVLRGIFVFNNAKSGDLYQVNSVILDEGSVPHAEGFWSSVKAQTLPMFKTPLLKNTVLISILFFIVFICINPYTVWMPFIVNAFMSSVEKGDIGLTMCSMIRLAQNSTNIEQEDDCSMNRYAMTMVFGITMILATFNLFMSGITKYIGRKTIFIGLQLVSGAAALCINFSTLWMLSAVLFIVFLTGILNFGFLATFSVDIFPTYVKAMAVCLTLMVGRGSAVLGINVLKKLLDTNCEAGFYIFGGLSVVGGLIGFLLPSDAKISEQKKSMKGEESP